MVRYLAAGRIDYCAGNLVGNGFASTDGGVAMKPAKKPAKVKLCKSCLKRHGWKTPAMKNGYCFCHGGSNLSPVLKKKPKPGAQRRQKRDKA